MKSDLNEIFNEFARALVGTITSDRAIAFPAQLPREGLDGSVESLKIVDLYLQFVHTHRKEISPAEWHTTVLWCGAYIGEVIRQAREGDSSRRGNSDRGQSEHQRGRMSRKQSNGRR